MTPAPARTPRPAPPAPPLPPREVGALPAAGVCAALIAVLAYVRLHVFPHEVVPLTYTLPLLVCLWHRNLWLHWVMATAFVLMVLTKWLLVAGDAVPSDARRLFIVMQLGNVVIPAAVLHGVVVLMARLRGAIAHLESGNAELEQSNEELAAREEEIHQQNEELQSQAEELEQQTEELTAQSSDLQALAEQLAVRESTLDHLLELSLAPASASDLLPRLGEALARLFAPRAHGAVVLELDGERWHTQPLFGFAAQPARLERTATLADAVVTRDRPGFLADASARPDLAARQLDDGRPSRSVLAASLRTGGAAGLPAALEIHSADPGDWSEQQLRLAQWAAEQVGRAWAAVRLRDDLDRQRLLLRTVTGSSSAALFLLDGDGVCTYANPAAERLTGWRADELATLPLRAALRRDGDGAWTSREYVLHRRDGSAFPAACTAVDVIAAAGRGDTVLEVRDVSEQRRIAAEREQLLASERAARGAAERANQAKDEFVATLSHELRTPLNAILGWATILRRNGHDRDVLEKGFEVIERNARHQGQLISDLLDVSRIVSGKLQLDMQPIDPLLVVEAALDAVRPAADAKGVRLERDLQPIAGTLRGDPGRLQQVVWNLLTNAVKFTPPGGSVRVALAAADGGAVVEVRDTGQGFAQELLPQLFQRHFSAGAPERRDQGGLGLGLAIVKHLVDLHGGTVEAHSDGPGRGATFRVVLPLRVAADAPRSRPPEATGSAPPPLAAVAELPALDGLAVLVVDDDGDSRELIERHLSERGAVVTGVASGREALAAASARRFHMLVSDIAMPEIDGYTLIRRLRSEAGLGAAELPAIAVTAFARSEDRTRALLAGFQSHISKPVEATELVATIATVRAMARTWGASG